MDGDKLNMKFVIVIMLFSLVSSAIVLIWFFKKKKIIKNRNIKDNIKDNTEPGNALKIWRYVAVFWPLCCVVFVGVIIYQSLQGIEERLIIDTGFVIIPLVFFVIGMAIYYRLLKERRYAVVLTTATVISRGWNTYSGKRGFFPEYEFQANGEKYKVISSSGYSTCYLKEGDKTDLYYALENPKIFYVPAMQKHDKRWAVLLCGIGIVYPFVGLFAPFIRLLFM